jgi:hypothetical protein
MVKPPVGYQLLHASRSFSRPAARFLCLIAAVTMGTHSIAVADPTTYDLDLSAFERQGAYTESETDIFGQLQTTERGRGVRKNLLSDGAIEVGPVIGGRISGDDEDSGDAADEFEWDVGGYVGYRFKDFGGDDSSLGLNLQMLGNPFGSESGWAMTPGVDYSTPIDNEWRLDARVFSSYGREGGDFGGDFDDQAAGLDSQEDPGFMDFGFSLGLGYSLADQLSVSTSAGYARARQTGQEGVSQDDEEWVGEFFGGVLLNYRF